MHRCLRIDEIVQQVANWIKLDGPTRDGSGGQDHNGAHSGQWLLHMALTCRGFREHALNALWRELWDLTPFLYTFPSGVVQKVPWHIGVTNIRNGLTPSATKSKEYWVRPTILNINHLNGN